MRNYLMTASVLAALSGPVVAQQPVVAPPPGRPAISPAVLEEMRRAEATNNALPDTPGTGAFASLKEEDPTLPAHVVYRPADLSKVGKAGLGIVAWGNGGCGADGANVRQHLAEIASHGYLVIASGTIKSGPGVAPSPPLVMPPPGPDGQRRLPPPATRVAQLTEAIDWAIAQNSKTGARYFGKLDIKAVAVSGWSCGGLQALKIASTDARVKTAVIHNSGVFTTPMPAMGIDIAKPDLARLRAPVLYVLGGKTDIAYANGMDDFAQISTVPVVVANLDVGHGGTFYQLNGGKAAQVAVKWLDWQLKGRADAKAYFAGPNCGLCRDPSWTVAAKGLAR